MRPRRIIEELLKKGFSQQWIAKNAQISQSTVHRLKEGETKHSRFDTAEKLKKIHQLYVEQGGHNEK